MREIVASMNRRSSDNYSSREQTECGGHRKTVLARDEPAIDWMDEVRRENNTRASRPDRQVSSEHRQPQKVC